MLLEVLVPGSCGEIAQGWKDGQPFLVTCPIGLYSRALVTERTSAKTGLGKKANIALKNTVNYMGFTEFPLGLALESQLPTGKGMAASTADIVAVIQAVATAIDDELAPEEVAELAAGIEPTDGVFYEGVVLMNYMTGQLVRSYKNVPKIIIAMFDTGGTVNTIDFHSDYSDNSGNADSPSELLEAVDSLSKDFSAENIGRVATISALANQKLLAKPQLDEIIEFAKSQGAIGVNVAHSGTMLGVMFKPDESMKKVLDVVRMIGDKFPHMEYFDVERLIPGGWIIRQR
ncbi:MAG: GHMP kinase [Anaerovibrio sp.]|uniref:GHMP family kinase ATP-binding protein n=1 Tax=Anaerovibrio sp. TaxID=1872532 RepID=UPI00260114FB|nr:GHMP kinase [Anaerovibrio sp.]MCR5177245.1 GHMP kinase [Anaerovibrio sp.]